MHRDDKSRFLLFIEPKLEDKSDAPVHDELLQVLRMAVQDAKLGVSNYDKIEEEPVFREGKRYKGTHKNCDEESSSNYDLLLPNGMITNTLCFHYLTWFRKAIPDNDLRKLEELQRYYGRVERPAPLIRW